MRLRIVFTLAILAGLAAAPGAQTFRWQAGRSDTGDRVESTVHRRVERAMERAARQIEQRLDRAERRWTRARRAWERSADRAAPTARQSASSTDPCDDSRDWGRDDEYEQHCEVRESTLPAGALAVDASPNGGIAVAAWDGSAIKVTAIVRTRARDGARAKELASEVRVNAGGGRVSASGPESSRREWWSVSYRVSVPKKTDLDLHTTNGGISVAGVFGRLIVDTTNGGIKLADVGGDVRGGTRNGGLHVSLSGTTWEGAGLDVETTNGGVSVSIPDGYNAQLEARTRNGGFRTDYPITVTGELSTRRGISATLGRGGAPVRVRTTNGGVTIERSRKGSEGF